MDKFEIFLAGLALGALLLMGANRLFGETPEMAYVRGFMDCHTEEASLDTLATGQLIISNTGETNELD